MDVHRDDLPGGAEQKLKVLHCDNHLLVVHKPACIPCVPDESGDESLLEQGKAWLKREYDKPGEVFLGVVHRLDRPVSGVLVFARTSKAAARLTAAFRDRKVKKRYWAVLSKMPRADLGEGGEIEQWLVKDRQRNRVRIGLDGEQGAKRALTRWRLLERKGGHVLAMLDPRTGRPHQLRAAMASLGAPLVGDLKYGATKALADRSIALHARSLEFEHPTRREPLRFEAPAPALDCWNFDTCRRS